MRRLTGSMIACGVLALVLGVSGLVQAAEITGARLIATQYTGGTGLFVALLWVPTTDKTLDVTLSLPGPDSKGQLALHPIQEWHLPNNQLFKFATKGKPVDADGDVIEVLITDPQSGDVGHAKATCKPLGSLYFVCQ